MCRYVWIGSASAKKSVMVGQHAIESNDYRPNGQLLRARSRPFRFRPASWAREGPSERRSRPNLTTRCAFRLLVRAPTSRLGFLRPWGLCPELRRSSKCADAFAHLFSYDSSSVHFRELRGQPSPAQTARPVSAAWSSSADSSPPSACLAAGLPAGAPASGGQQEPRPRRQRRLPWPRERVVLLQSAQGGIGRAAALAPVEQWRQPWMKSASVSALVVGLIPQGAGGARVSLRRSYRFGL